MVPKNREVIPPKCRIIAEPPAKNAPTKHRRPISANNLRKLRAKKKSKRLLKKRAKWNIDLCHPSGQLPTKRNTTHSKCAIVGHSFVTRLLKELTKKYKAGGSWSQSLDILGYRTSLFIKGTSGLTIDRFNEITEYLKEIQPDAVIIELGSNDICKEEENMFKLAYKLFSELTNLLKEVPSIQSIVWCHVTPRLRIIRSKKKLKDYNKDVHDFNRLMKGRTNCMERAHHWRHRGLTRPTWLLMEDGLHPDTNLGLFRYLKSIGAACKWLKENNM